MNANCVYLIETPEASGVPGYTFVRAILRDQLPEAA